MNSHRVDINGTTTFTIFGDGEDMAKDLKHMPVMYHEFYPYAGKKSKWDYPYSYDPFMVWYNDEVKTLQDDDGQLRDVSTIYTDRLLQWDWDKHNELCRKHFGDEGQLWNDRDPKKIQAFLCDWTDKKIVLIANVQYVNVSNGYPVWRLDFYYE
jgi:hypothetical protein